MKSSSAPGAIVEGKKPPVFTPTSVFEWLDQDIAWAKKHGMVLILNYLVTKMPLPDWWSYSRASSAPEAARETRLAVVHSRKPVVIAQ